jgi:hypothetical protein
MSVYIIITLPVLHQDVKLEPSRYGKKLNVDSVGEDLAHGRYFRYKKEEVRGGWRKLRN